MTRRYRVVLAARAESDILAIKEFIAADKPRAAEKWIRAVRKAIASLSSFPFRNEIIPEVDDLEMEYRHLIHGSYRIVFRVEGDVVIVARVVHAARLLKPGFFRSP